MKEWKMEIPEWWAVCQNGKCELADGCLRYKVFERIGMTVDKWTSVMPGAMNNGKCRCFVKDEKVKIARGFDNMFAHVKRRGDRSALRQQLTDYLGSKGTYYRYKHGERLLSPEQQRWILDLFRRYGYTENVDFDNYICDYYYIR